MKDLAHYEALPDAMGTDELREELRALLDTPATATPPVHGNHANMARALYELGDRQWHTYEPLPPELREVVAKISKRVTEAYSVLRDPRRRQAYDRMLDETSGKRMQLAEAKAEARRQAQENEGRTPQGRQYYALARAAMEREDWGGAARNLQTALTFEPDNAFFKERLKPPARAPA